jgi:6-phosphogluconate dehydrogenase
MQAYAEGFDIMKHANSQEVDADHRYTFDITEISELWRRGSVVGSWLLDLTAMALTEDGELSKFTGNVQDSGEGRWTIMAAIEEAVPCDVLGFVVRPLPVARITRREDASGMRNKFGGHVECAAGRLRRRA